MFNDLYQSKIVFNARNYIFSLDITSASRLLLLSVIKIQYCSTCAWNMFVLLGILFPDNCFLITWLLSLLPEELKSVAVPASHC